MPPPRYPLAEPLVGSGDLDISGPVGSQVARDWRSRGFWAKITSQPDAAKNAYGFIRLDDFTPTAALVALTGAIEQGDGTSLAAFEVSGSLTVPTDAVVWLEPLRTGAGYGFRYGPTSSTSGAIDSAAGTTPFPISSSDTWLDAGFTWTIPAVSKCLLAGSAKFLAKVSAIGGDAYVQSRVLNVTSGQIVSGSMSITSILNAGVFVMFAHKFAEFQNVVVPTTLRWEVYRSSGGTWTTCQAGPPNFTNGDPAVFTLSYVAP